MRYCWLITRDCRVPSGTCDWTRSSRGPHHPRTFWHVLVDTRSDCGCAVSFGCASLCTSILAGCSKLHLRAYTIEVLFVVNKDDKIEVDRAVDDADNIKNVDEADVERTIDEDNVTEVVDVVGGTVNKVKEIDIEETVDELDVTAAMDIVEVGESVDETGIGGTVAGNVDETDRKIVKIDVGGGAGPVVNVTSVEEVGGIAEETRPGSVDTSEEEIEAIDEKTGPGTVDDAGEERDVIIEKTTSEELVVGETVSVITETTEDIG